MMKIIIVKYSMLIAMGVLLLNACVHDEWEKHYDSQSEMIDAKMWDAIQDSAKYSKFVDLIIESRFDTLLEKDQSFTLFIPSNEAFENFSATGNELADIMAYHISPTVMVAGSVKRERRLQTVREKFALITNTTQGMYFDEVPISNNSPLFKDGTFYEMADIAKPRPSIIEYMQMNSPVLYNYIKSRRVVLLDKNESTPLYFNKDGETVYDSVYVDFNFFDLLYFSSTNFEGEKIPTRFEDFEVWVDQNPGELSLLKEPNYSVEEEFRDIEKTFITFTQEQYNEALDVMAENLGDQFSGYESIPADWQDDVLIPYLFESGVFDSSLTYNRFLGDVLKNSLGDSIYFDHRNINPASRFLCSNGVTYQYTNFTVPDSLYNDTIWVQGEDLIESVNNDIQFAEDVEVSDKTFLGQWQTISNASEGKIYYIDLGRSFTDEFWIKFKIPKVFPRKYYFRYAANNLPSGVIDVYVNDVLLGSQDNFLYSGAINGAEGRQIPIDRKLNFNSWEVDFITEYGDVDVKLVYTGKGRFPSQNGICIDYVALVPVTN